MRLISGEEITKTVAELCLKACCELPLDVVRALEKASAAEDEQSPAREVIAQILENAKLAREKMRPCCQDTGMTLVFLDIGFQAHIEGDVYAAVNAGVAKAYTEGYLRKSVLSPITRVNTGDNTPAVTHIRFVPGDRVKISVAPKGFGSENMSRLAMLTPAAGEEGVIDFIVETVRLAGACFCPPGVLGVGVGGTMESCALLAKRQLLRPLGQPTEDTETARIEREAFRRVNALGIGPMGLGGKTTVLAVHAASEPTHIAGLPVAVSMQCHACRHAERTI